MTKEEMLEEWQAYLPPLTRQPDFDAYWAENLAMSQTLPLNTRIEPAGAGEKAEHFHVFFKGCDDSQLHAILLVPKGEKENIPVMVHYHGFGGNCGRFEDFYPFVDTGCAVLSLDIRGQGGISQNRFPYSKSAGLITGGAHDKKESYLKWQTLDCIRALDVAWGLPFARRDLLIVEGGSQGGGIAVAMCGLDRRVTHCLCDVPSNSDLLARLQGRHGMFDRFNVFMEKYPQCREDVLRTLSYFDTMNMAHSIKARVFASVGGRDCVCPPKMFFASYNRIPSSRRVFVYPQAWHEGGGAEHQAQKVAYLAGIVKGAEAFEGPDQSL